MNVYQNVINHYYKEDTPLWHILLTHSRQVADHALLVSRRHPELCLDEAFLENAAMLHDIGIIRCNAPSIHCFGNEPYIRHGLIGAAMLTEYFSTVDRSSEESSSDSPCLASGQSPINGDRWQALARVCSRHTGAGITREDVERQGLPLPLQDFLPETLEEQVICYADKFYSKTHLDREKTPEEAEHSLLKFGDDGVVRFRRWHEMFG